MNYITDIAPYVSAENLPLLDVLGRLNAVEGLLQAVVRSDGTFVGTITDGDVRRALLKGASLADPASVCVFTRAAYGSESDPDAVIEQKLDTLDHVRPCIPILDAAHRVVRIAFRDREEPKGAIGLVMAGGRGQRLGERTDSTPKPLLEVGGKPMLERVLLSLDDAGIDPIFVSAHYLADQIESFASNWAGKATLNVLREDHPLGTAGSLQLLPIDSEYPALVINGDVLTNLDIRGFIAFHRRQRNDGTIAVATHEFTIPYGVVQQSEEGLFDGMLEKPRITNFVASGIYLLESEFAALIPESRPIDMPELLKQGKKVGLKIGLYPVHEEWTDIGLPDQLDEADRRMREQN